jgi:glycosyltransferase involved in cell wall biosynthesis
MLPDARGFRGPLPGPLFFAATEMTALRVMHVVVGGDIGGAERIVAELAARRERTGAHHQAAVITPNRALAEYFVSAGVQIHDRGEVRESPLAYLVRSLGPSDVAWLAELLVRERIDIVHTHTFGSHVLGTRAARRARVRQVRTEHDVAHYFDPSCSPFTRWAAARTQRLVAVSRYVYTVLARTAPRAAPRMTVVRNGLDSSYWVPLAPPAREGPFRAGIVCRLTAWKRVDVAVKAAAMAGVDLLVVGEGEERARLTGLARRAGASVTFAGRHADPRPLFAECDVVLSTALNEPFGLSVLEALAMQRPVIACAGGGMAEIVQDGLTGWLVAEPTPAGFAAAIARARESRSRLQAMGEEGRRFVTSECEIDRMCQGYAAVYRSALGDS